MPHFNGLSTCFSLLFFSLLLLWVCYFFFLRIFLFYCCWSWCNVFPFSMCVLRTLHKFTSSDQIALMRATRRRHMIMSTINVGNFLEFWPMNKITSANWAKGKTIFIATKLLSLLLLLFSFVMTAFHSCCRALCHSSIIIRNTIYSVWSIWTKRYFRTVTALIEYVWAKPIVQFLTFSLYQYQFKYKKNVSMASCALLWTDDPLSNKNRHVYFNITCFQLSLKFPQKYHTNYIIWTNTHPHTKDKRSNWSLYFC